MVLQPFNYGFPGGVIVVDVPAMAFGQTMVTEDEFEFDLSRADAFDSDGIRANGTNTMRLENRREPSVTAPFFLDTPLVQHTDFDADSQMRQVECDEESHGTLEAFGDFEGVYHTFLGYQSRSDSLPLYVIAGQTVDYTTLTPIAGATVRAFDTLSNNLLLSVVSDGSGNYSIPCFDQRDYFLVAHVGNDPAGVTRIDVKGE
jgi:hypothetical protein